MKLLLAFVVSVITVFSQTTSLPTTQMRPGPITTNGLLYAVLPDGTPLKLDIGPGIRINLSPLRLEVIPGTGSTETFVEGEVPNADPTNPLRFITVQTVKNGAKPAVFRNGIRQLPGTSIDASGNVLPKGDYVFTSPGVVQFSVRYCVTPSPGQTCPVSCPTQAGKCPDSADGVLVDYRAGVP